MAKTKEKAEKPKQLPEKEVQEGAQAQAAEEKKALDAAALVEKLRQEREELSKASAKELEERRKKAKEEAFADWEKRSSVKNPANRGVLELVKRLKNAKQPLNEQEKEAKKRFDILRRAPNDAKAREQYHEQLRKMTPEQRERFVLSLRNNKPLQANEVK